MRPEPAGPAPSYQALTLDDLLLQLDYVPDGMTDWMYFYPFGRAPEVSVYGDATRFPIMKSTADPHPVEGGWA